MREYLKKLQSLAESLRNQHDDIYVDSTYNLLRASEILNDYLTNDFRKTGLNRTQVMILHFLLASGGTVTPRDIKSKIFRSLNAISKSLDSLDALGLTRSSRPKSDRRQRRVSLTEKGLKMMEKILPVRRQLFNQATSCLSQSDAEAFASILSQLESHLLSITGRSPKSKQQKFYF